MHQMFVSPSQTDGALVETALGYGLSCLPAFKAVRINTTMFLRWFLTSLMGALTIVAGSPPVSSG